MRKLDVEIISDSKAMPVKSGTLGFLQRAYGELFAEVLQELYPGSALNTQVTAVRGCVASGTSPNFALTAGAIFVGGGASALVEPYGELFLLPTPQNTTTSGDNAILVLGTSYFTAANADPVTFTDGSPNNVHQIRTLTLTHGDSSTANYICDLNAIVPAVAPWTVNYTEAALIVSNSSVTVLSNNLPGNPAFAFARSTTGNYTLTLSQAVLGSTTLVLKGGGESYIGVNAAVSDVYITSSTVISIFTVNTNSFTEADIAGAGIHLLIRVYN